MFRDTERYKLIPCLAWRVFNIFPAAQSYSAVNLQLKLLKIIVEGMAWDRRAREKPHVGEG